MYKKHILSTDVPVKHCNSDSIRCHGKCVLNKIQIRGVTIVNV